MKKPMRITAYQRNDADHMMVTIQKKYFIFCTFFIREGLGKWFMPDEAGWQVMHKIAFNRLMRKPDNIFWEALEAVPEEVISFLGNVKAYEDGTLVKIIE